MLGNGKRKQEKFRVEILNGVVRVGLIEMMMFIQGLVEMSEQAIWVFGGSVLLRERTACQLCCRSGIRKLWLLGQI